MRKHPQRNFRKMAIRGKTFTVAFLWTYIAKQQGHNSQEKIRDGMKTVTTTKVPCILIAVYGTTLQLIIIANGMLVHAYIQYSYCLKVHMTNYNITLKLNAAALDV